MNNGDKIRTLNNRQLAESLVRNLGHNSCDGCIVPISTCRHIEGNNLTEDNEVEECTNRIEKYLDLEAE
jgi:hypothetical protein